jgi:hypothetical protein
MQAEIDRVLRGSQKHRRMAICVAAVRRRAQWKKRLR